MELNPKVPATPRESANQALRALGDRINSILGSAERYGVAHTSSLKNWREIADQVSEAMEDIASAEIAEDEADE